MFGFRAQSFIQHDVKPSHAANATATTARHKPGAEDQSAALSVTVVLPAFPCALCAHVHTADGCDFILCK